MKPYYPYNEKRRIGDTDLYISALGFGGSPLGSVFREINEQDGIDAVHKAIKMGINFFDTSPFYGITKSETVLGKALKTVPRSDFVLATKVGRYGQQEFDFRAETVIESVEASMKRLNVEYLDVVQCHDIEFGDLKQVVYETLPTLQKLKEQGKIKAIGVTGYPLSIFPYVLENSKVKLDLVLSYCHYTLNDTSLADSVPLFKQHNLGVINASALCMGLLTPFGGPDWHPAPPELKEASRKAAQLCTDRGSNLAEVALQYSFYSGPLANGEITSTLVGFDCVETLDQNIEILGRDIDEHLLKDVLDIFKPVHNTTWPSGK